MADSDPVTNEIELASAIDKVSGLLQKITDYTTSNANAKSKQNIIFPKRFVKTRKSYSLQFEWMLDDTLKRNISYEYIFADILRWLSDHTNLYGPARQMLYKHTIVIFAAILESLLTGFFKQVDFVERKTIPQVNKLLAKKIINKKLHAEISWLWDLRQRVHLFLLETLELESYKITDVKRALLIINTLEKCLTSYFDN